MKKSRLNILAALIVILPMLVGCRQGLCYDHYPALDIEFTWEQEWERDYGQYHTDTWDADHYGIEYDDMRPNIPEWVNMVRYFDNGSSTEHYLSPDGENLTVDDPRGCSMLLYNGDTEYIVLSDLASLNHARATATTRSRAYSALDAMYEKNPNARTTNPPDVIYSAYIENVEDFQNHDRKHFPIKMQPLVFSYMIDYEFEYGIHNVAVARGAIGGMAESVYLRDGITSDETTIILFDCDVTTHGCQSQVRTFGIPSFPDKYYGRNEAIDIDHPITLNLEVVLNNGKTINFNYDVTDQLQNQPRGGIIKISGIRIEDDETKNNSSGFVVDLSDWDDNAEVIDLPLNNQDP